MIRQRLVLLATFFFGILVGYLLNNQYAHEPDTENQAPFAENTPDPPALAPDAHDGQPMNATPEYNIDSPEEYSLSAYDFSTSLEKILALQPGENRAAQIRMVLDRWSLQDPQAALDWLRTQPFDSETESYYYQVMQQYMVTDIELAGYALQELPTEALRKSLTGQYIFHLASTNREQALNWALSTSEQAFQQAFGIMSEQDPQAALNYLKTMGPAVRSGVIGGAIKQAAVNLSRENRMDVKKVLNDYPEDVRQHLVAGIAHAWAESDRAAAAEWVESLNNQTLKDKAVQGFVDGTINDDPVEAFRLTSLVSDSPTRLALMFNIVSQWPDDKAARLVVEQTPNLSNEQRNLLLAQIAINN